MIYWLRFVMTLNVILVPASNGSTPMQYGGKYDLWAVSLMVVIIMLNFTIQVIYGWTSNSVMFM